MVHAMPLNYGITSLPAGGIEIDLTFAAVLLYNLYNDYGYAWALHHSQLYACRLLSAC